MSIDFQIQRDPKKTIEIKQDDFNDINLDDLDDFNIQNELDKSSDSSIVFTKEPVRVKSKSKSPDKNRINVKVRKDSEKIQVPFNKPPPKQPSAELNSMDLGLDMIANQKKKNIPKQEDDSQSQAFDFLSNDSKSSRKSNKSLSLDFNDLDKVRNIMDEKSESSKDSSHSNSSILSNRIRDKIKSKSVPINENDRRQELLFMFEKLQKRGVKIPQKFNARSSIDEMEKTYERLKNERDIQNSIKFQRKLLMGFVSTIEFLNHTMNKPFDIDLDGWSESVMENYSEYDDIFEELYEKYKNKGQISPEVKLVMTLAGSAFYFHLTKMIIKPAQEKMQEMFGNIDPNGPAPDMGGFMSGLMNNFMGGGGGGGNFSKPPNSGGMRGPQGFDDILSKADSDIPSINSAGKKKGRTLNV